MSFYYGGSSGGSGGGEFTKTDISGKPQVLAALADMLLAGDASNADELVKIPIQDIYDLCKAYADSLLGANDAMVFKDVINCSTNPDYPAADTGHVYKVSVAGKIGGASGLSVEVNDMITCIVDSSPSGDDATVGANWAKSQGNLEVSSYIATLLNDIDATTARQTLGLIIGTDVQAFSATLSAMEEVFTTALKEKIDHLTVTQDVDLNQMETDVAANNAKTSNATHTGDVTGSTALSIDKTAITGKTEVDPIGGDFVLGSDNSDSDNLKKFDIKHFLSIAPKENEDESTNQTISSSDLGKGKIITLDSTTTADREFTLPDTNGLSISDGISFYNDSDHELKIKLAGASDKINSLVTERILMKGQGLITFFPIASKDIWATRS